MSDNGSTPRGQGASAPPTSAPIGQELVPAGSVSPNLYASVTAYARGHTTSPITAQTPPARGIHLPVPGSHAASSNPNRNLTEALDDRASALAVEQAGTAPPPAAASRGHPAPPPAVAGFHTENAAPRTAPAEYAEYERQRRREVRRRPDQVQPEPVRPARPPAGPPPPVQLRNVGYGREVGQGLVFI